MKKITTHGIVTRMSRQFSKAKRENWFQNILALILLVFLASVILLSTCQVKIIGG